MCFHILGSLSFVLILLLTIVFNHDRYFRIVKGISNMINTHLMDVLPALVNRINTVNTVKSSDTHFSDQVSTRLPSNTPKRASAVYCWLSYFLL